MELSLTNITYPHHPLPTPHHRRHHSKSILFPKSLTFPSLTQSKTSILLNPNNINYQNPNHHHHTPKSPNPNPNPNPLSPLKTTFITTITVAAVLLSRLTLKPAIATPTPPPPPATVETLDSKSDEETLEQHLCTHPEDTQTLKTLMEVKIKNGKPLEAIGILNQLINLEPEDSEWQLLKYHLYSYSGDHEAAKLGFEEIIKKDPMRVEAYHGLVMAVAAADESSSSAAAATELTRVEKQILDAVESCKKQKRKDELRDFKLLLAQIRVIQSEYDSALRIYQELCKEEPRDFRPYLCQGIIYTLLGRKDDAEKSFDKYRRLVPKGHPYTRYFDENMVATKVFAEKLGSERAYAKS